MKGVRVMGLFEVSRGNVDFSSLGGECFLRENSIISIQDRGHPHANPARQADRQTGRQADRQTGRQTVEMFGYCRRIYL